MKKILFALSLLLTVFTAFGKGVSSPRSGTVSDGHAGSGNHNYYSPIDCFDETINIVNNNYDSDYTQYGDDPDKGQWSMNIGTLTLQKVYVFNQQGTLDSLNFSTSDGGKSYNISGIRGVYKDQFGRLEIHLVFKSTTNSIVGDICYLQFVCPEFQIAWIEQTEVKVRGEVEKYNILSGTGKVIVNETSEHSIDVSKWVAGDYIVQVLAPEELAGKYTVTIESEDNNFVFPNPASDYIQFKEPVERCVLRDEKGEAKGDFQKVEKIDLQEFEEGVYYLQIITDDKISKTYRIIIKK